VAAPGKKTLPLRGTVRHSWRMLMPRLSALFLLACALPFAGFSAEPDLVTLTVHPNTLTPVTRNLPANAFRTLPEAVAAARALRPQGVGPEVVILLRDGRHQLESVLQLRPEDSRLALVAAPGARPVITSARRLTGWAPVPQRAGWWQTTLPAGQGDFRTLFADGRRAVRARTPNEGEYFQMVGQRFSDDPVRFHFRRSDLPPALAAEPQLELVGFEKWTSFRQYLRGVDAVSNAATLSFKAAAHTREPNARYYVENARVALDAPGEWHLDRATRVLTYVARPGENPAQMEFLVPALTQLIEVEGAPAGDRLVERLTLRGLTFAHTDWQLAPEGQVDVQAAVAISAAITVVGAKRFVLADCTLEQLGGYGLSLGRGCDAGRVTGCVFQDLGAGGLKLGETRVPGYPEQQSGNHIVADNRMSALGRVNPTAVGVLILHSGGNLVAHNTIHDLFYTAISVGWTWGYRDSACRDNRIEFNHLYQVGQGMLSDMGGIYTLGPQPGTVLRNNHIHDVESHGYGGWGLYTDEGSTGILLESNVVYRCKSAGFHQHYGKENILRYNVLALNREHELMRTRDEEHISFFFTNNVVYFSTGDLLGSSWRNNRFVMDRNVYFDTRLAANQGALRFAGKSLADWRAAGHDQNSVLADPRFVAPDKFDFRVQTNSPALALGFHPPDVRKAGVRPQADRPKY
jgi:hypothetical protein